MPFEKRKQPPKNQKDHALGLPKAGPFCFDSNKLIS